MSATRAARAAYITTTDGITHRGRTVTTIVRRVYGRGATLNYARGDSLILATIRRPGAGIVARVVDYGGPYAPETIQTVRDDTGAPVGTVERLQRRVRTPEGGSTTAPGAWLATRPDGVTSRTEPRRRDAVAWLRHKR